MRRVEGVEVYHHPDKCLRHCRIVLKGDGIQWEIRFGSIREPLPENLCAGGRHTHESWVEYRKCYAQLPEKYAFHRELHSLRGNKTHELCRKCADIFADHDSDQCQIGVEGEEPSLLKLWDDPTGNFVRFIGTMVQHADGTRAGPCPLCTTQVDQHDYATCLCTATIRLEGGQLNITTGRRRHGDPLPDPDPLLGPDPPVPDPNPLGPTPGMTPRTAQSLRGPVPTGDTP